MLAVLAAVMTVVFSVFQSNVAQRKAVQTFRNMQVIHLTMQQITLDQETSGGAIRWTCSNGVPLTYAQWTNLIVSEKYLTPEQLFDRLQLSDPERTIIPLAVAESDPPDTIVMVTKNWPGQAVLAEKGLVTGNYAYLRKGGPVDTNNTSNPNTGAGGKFGFQPLK